MIVEPELKHVDVNKIKLDPDNPNVMTDEQMAALKESMERFGYLEPIIIDQHNVIADGEHRLQVYKEFKRKQIPAFKIRFTNDNERRLLRQAKNKLKRQHDPGKDYDELLKLQKYDFASLGSLLTINEAQLNEIKRLADVNARSQLVAEPSLEDTRYQDKPMLDHHHDTFLHGNIKQIVLYFNNEEYQQVVPKLAKVMELLGTDNHTDMVKMLTEEYLERNQNKKEKGTRSSSLRT